MALDGSVVLITLHRFCGADYTRLGSVVLMNQDWPYILGRLCGADLPRLTVWPWVALWC